MYIKERGEVCSKGGKTIPHVLQSFILPFSLKDINLVNLETKRSMQERNGRERKFTEIVPRTKGSSCSCPNTETSHIA